MDASLKNLKKSHFLLHNVLTSTNQDSACIYLLKIGDVWYDNMTKITIKVQLFWRLPY